MLPMNWLLEHVQFGGDNCLTWPFAKSPAGYAQIKRAGQTAMATRLMCELAHGAAPSALHQAAHSCGKGHAGCINPNHLRWATPVENNADKKRHGTEPRGEQRTNARLSSQQVLEIRQSRGVHELVLAERYGVSRSAIHNVIGGYTWRHLIDAHRAAMAE
jgi:hypothetical protein